MLIVLSKKNINLKRDNLKLVFFVQDLESFYLIRALPYCVSLYRLRKTACKINRDLRIGDNRNFKNRIQNRKNIIGDKIDTGWFYKLELSEHKNSVDTFNLHEIMNRISGDKTGDWEMIGDVFKGEYEQTTAMRFEIFVHYES